jgi:ATP-binding cassette subfamily F protein 3
MGQLEADKGDLDLPGKARIASVAQETPSLPDPAIDFVLSGDVAVHAAIQAEANAFANEDWEAVAEAHHRLEELNGYDASARAGACCMAWDSRPKRMPSRCRIFRAAGACGSTSPAR